MSLDLGSFVPQMGNSSLTIEKLKKTTFVGIDFGTSTTVVSYTLFSQEKQKIETKQIPIPQELADGRICESELIPSVVAWSENRLLIGQGARQLKEKLTKDRNLWYSFKMELGVDLGKQYYNSELSQWHEITTVQTPKDVATVFFKYLKEKIEEYLIKEDLPRKIEYSISIPASFEANQRKDLIEALEKAGISIYNHALVDEPNAAFISYLADSNFDNFYQPLNILVFDFGAGTCDISILEIGKNQHDQLYSKNLSISKFLVLGGDNIDREIAREILLPQLLERNELSINELTTVEIKKRLIPSLQPTAENLKRDICTYISSQQIIPNQLPKIAYSSEKVFNLSKTVSVILPRRDRLLLENPKMSCQEMAEIMKSFLSDDLKVDNEDLISIFIPIESALEKADLVPSNLDMILLIGGSVKNPYLQEAIQKKYANECEIELPRDPQIHVSKGAAIHSFLINGLGTTFIKPITSEAFIVKIRDSGWQTIFKPSTSIPCPKKLIEGFYVIEESQQKIQIPICVGSEQKILTIIEIESPNQIGFKKGTSVSLICELTQDKLLKVEALVNSKSVKSIMTNPFANRELTIEERQLLETEKEVNNETAANGGRPTIQGLLKLKEAYVRVNNFVRAAEVLESVQQMNPSDSYETSICYHYSRAGYSFKQNKWAERAYQREKTDVTAFNLALSKRKQGQMREHDQLMEEALRLNTNSFFTLQYYGQYLYDKGSIQRGQELLGKALSIMYHLFLENGLNVDDYPRLITVATHFKRSNIIDEVTKAQQKWQRTSNVLNEEMLLAHDSPDYLPNREV